MIALVIATMATSTAYAQDLQGRIQDLSFLRSFAVEDTCIKDNGAGGDVFYLLLHSDSATYESVVRAARKEMTNAVISSRSGVTWLTLRKKTFRLSVMLFRGKTQRERIETAKPYPGEKGRTKCLISYTPLTPKPRAAASMPIARML